MRRISLLSAWACVLVTTVTASASTFYLHQTGSPVAVPGGTTTFILDENAPVAGTPVAASVSVPKKTQATLPTFIAPAFAAPATLGLDFNVVVHVSANLAMNACGGVSATIEKVDSGGGRSPLASGSVDMTIPQGGGGGTTGFAPATVGFSLTCASPTQDASIAAGESIAVTISVTNNCKANRTVFLAYDSTTAPGSATFDPLPPPDPIFLRACFSKCQLATSKATAKFYGAKSKCVLKCQISARKGLVPFTDCDAPYAGATAACVANPFNGAETKATASILKVCTQPGRCPTCYGDCNEFGFDIVNIYETLIDGLMPTVFCDPTSDKEPFKCMSSVSSLLSKFMAGKAKCYDRCFANEIKGIAAPGSCLPPAVDQLTGLCISRIEDRTRLGVDKYCFTPPAMAPGCYPSSGLGTGLDWVDLAEGMEDSIIPGIYCASPSGAFVE